MTPISILRQIRAIVEPPEGVLVVEVPHARDFLLNEAVCQSFVEFTLWSQHLVLHSRDSLTRLLQAAGFTDVKVYGLQRYGLANHMTGLTQGQPGGHKGPLAPLETRELSAAYGAALAAQDSTDTLVAIAR